MIVTASHQVTVNGQATRSFTGDPPLTITGGNRVTVTLTNNHDYSVISKLADAAEHKIPAGQTVRVVLLSRELRVYDVDRRGHVRTRLAVSRRRNS